MSKINESPKNKEEKSSKLIIISKDRIESAKNRVNFMTLKEGELELTVRLGDDSLNKNDINKAVKNIKDQILKNSSSYVTLYEKSHNMNTYFKKKNILKTPISEKSKISLKNLDIKKKENLIIETSRSNNFMKTTDNNKLGNEEDNNKLETIIPNELNTEENLKVNSSINVNDYKKDINITNNKIKINNFNNFIPIEISSKGDENKDNNSKNENIIIDGHLISKNYYNNAKNYKKKKNFDKYKSEEIKQINSNSSRGKVFEKVKSNNYFEKNNQRSDKAAKSISDHEHEQDNKNNAISKLVLDSGRIENNKSQRLMTENDNIYTKDDKNDLVSESKSSETIKVDDEIEEEEKEKDNNLLKEEENKNKNIVNQIKNLMENKIISNSIFDLNNNVKNGKDINLRTVHSMKEKQNNNTFKICSICDIVYPLSRFFMSECQRHHICRKCAKNFYEDIIENGAKEILCPFTKCKQPVDLDKLQTLISKEHYNLLINKEPKKNKLYFAKIKTNIDSENLQLYTKKNVIDINNNKNFFDYNNLKEVYCPDCNNDTLFSKTNTNFFKCLNCECKKCKFCLKDYTPRHMDINYFDHCKVRLRYDDEEKNKTNNFLNYLLQLFFVFATYYLFFVGTFLIIRNYLLYLFGISLKGRNIFIVILIYLLTILCLLIITPFIIFFYPYFPSILALTDY